MLRVRSPRKRGEPARLLNAGAACDAAPAFAWASLPPAKRAGDWPSVGGASRRAAKSGRVWEFARGANSHTRSNDAASVSSPLKGEDTDAADTVEAAGTKEIAHYACISASAKFQINHADGEEALPMTDIIGPTSHLYYSQRLKLHYVDWGNHDKPLAILLHGGRDHCRSWDFVALALRNHFHVVAVDLRGHGDSDWAIGGSYSITDHVLDVGQLVNALEPREPVVLIGHSLGAGVALQRAGVFPESVGACVAIEGLGPP